MNKHLFGKILLFIISVVLVLTLFGCNTTSTPTPSAVPSTNSPSVVTSTPQVSSGPATDTPTNASDTRSITDMFGRTVIVPANITRVLTSGPVEMELVYLIAPDKLAGLSFNFNGNPALVPDKYKQLPMVGGWFGTQTGNYETFIAARPDIILEGTQSVIEERQQKFGPIPVVGVAAGDSETNYANDALTQYENEIRFLGELLGAQTQAENLIAYYNSAMKYVTDVVNTIPESDRIKVYYAEGKEGFNTDPVGSMHTRLLEFCGGINVAEVDIKPGYGMAESSLEQIILWDPDMIIIGRGSQSSLYKNIMTDPQWSQLRAVQSKQIAIRPDNPLSWFDGPPGPCQIVGMYWMINKLYPEKTADLDLNERIKEFYSQFLHYELTDAELTQLLANPN